MDTTNSEPITVETLSLSPRVYRLENFFTPDEADEVVESALALTDPDFKLKRSTTGTKGAAVSSTNVANTSSTGLTIAITTISVANDTIMIADNYW